MNRSRMRRRMSTVRSFPVVLFVLLLMTAGLGAPAAAQEAIPPAAAFGSDTDDPAWVLLERGKTAYRSREYGEALALLRRAVGKRNPYPEAEMLIGEIFEREANYLLAEQQYRKAWEQRDRLEVPGQRYEVLHRLASLYSMLQRYDRYEEELLRIIGDDRLYAEDGFADRLVEILTERGADKLLELYRLEPDFATRAQSELGYFYYRSGRYDGAVKLLTFSASKRLSRVVEAVRKRNPDYDYAGISGAFSAASRYPEIERYIRDSQVYRDLYYLADSLHGAGSRGPAEAVWNMLALDGGAGEWGQRAQRQLVRPVLEPFIGR